MQEKSHKKRGKRGRGKVRGRGSSQINNKDPKGSNERLSLNIQDVQDIHEEGQNQQNNEVEPKQEVDNSVIEEVLPEPLLNEVPPYEIKIEFKDGDDFSMSSGDKGLKEEINEIPIDPKTAPDGNFFEKLFSSVTNFFEDMDKEQKQNAQFAIKRSIESIKGDNPCSYKEWKAILDKKGSYSLEQRQNLYLYSEQRIRTLFEDNDNEKEILALLNTPGLYNALAFGENSNENIQEENAPQQENLKTIFDESLNQKIQNLLFDEPNQLKNPSFDTDKQVIDFLVSLHYFFKTTPHHQMALEIPVWIERKLKQIYFPYLKVTLVDKKPPESELENDVLYLRKIKQGKEVSFLVYSSRLEHPKEIHKLQLSNPFLRQSVDKEPKGGQPTVISFPFAVVNELVEAVGCNSLHPHCAKERYEWAEWAINLYENDKSLFSEAKRLDKIKRWKAAQQQAKRDQMQYEIDNLMLKEDPDTALAICKKFIQELEKDRLFNSEERKSWLDLWRGQGGLYTCLKDELMNDKRFSQRKSDSRRLSKSYLEVRKGSTKSQRNILESKIYPKIREYLTLSQKDRKIKASIIAYEIKATKIKDDEPFLKKEMKESLDFYSSLLTQYKLDPYFISLLLQDALEMVNPDFFKLNIGQLLLENDLEGLAKFLDLLETGILAEYRKFLIPGFLQLVFSYDKYLVVSIANNKVRNPNFLNQRVNALLDNKELKDSFSFSCAAAYAILTHSDSFDLEDIKSIPQFLLNLAQCVSPETFLDCKVQLELKRSLINLSPDEREQFREQYKGIQLQSFSNEIKKKPSIEKKAKTNLEKELRKMIQPILDGKGVLDEDSFNRMLLQTFMTKEHYQYVLDHWMNEAQTEALCKKVREGQSLSEAEIILIALYLEKVKSLEKAMAQAEFKKKSNFNKCTYDKKIFSRINTLDKEFSKFVSVQPGDDFLAEQSFMELLKLDDLDVQLCVEIFNKNLLSQAQIERLFVLRKFDRQQNPLLLKLLALYLPFNEEMAQPYLGPRSTGVADIIHYAAELAPFLPIEKRKIFLEKFVRSNSLANSLYRKGAKRDYEKLLDMFNDLHPYKKIKLLSSDSQLIPPVEVEAGTLYVHLQDPDQFIIYSRILYLQKTFGQEAISQLKNLQNVKLDAFFNDLKNIELIQTKDPKLFEDILSICGCHIEGDSSILRFMFKGHSLLDPKCPISLDELDRLKLDFWIREALSHSVIPFSQLLHTIEEALLRGNKKYGSRLFMIALSEMYRIVDRERYEKIREEVLKLVGGINGSKFFKGVEDFILSPLSVEDRHVYLAGCFDFLQEMLDLVSNDLGENRKTQASRKIYEKNIASLLALCDFVRKETRDFIKENQPPLLKNSTELGIPKQSLKEENKEVSSNTLFCLLLRDKGNQISEKDILDFLHTATMPDLNWKADGYAKFFDYVLNAYFALENGELNNIKEIMGQINPLRSEYFVDLNDKGESALIRAIKEQDQELFKYLALHFKGEDLEHLLNAEDKEGKDVFHYLLDFKCWHWANEDMKQYLKAKAFKHPEYGSELIKDIQNGDKEGFCNKLKSLSSKEKKRLLYMSDKEGDALYHLAKQEHFNWLTKKELITFYPNMLKNCSGITPYYFGFVMELRGDDKEAKVNICKVYQELTAGSHETIKEQIRTLMKQNGLITLENACLLYGNGEPDFVNLALLNKLRDGDYRFQFGDKEQTLLMIAVQKGDVALFTQIVNHFENEEDLKEVLKLRDSKGRNVYNYLERYPHDEMKNKIPVDNKEKDLVQHINSIGIFNNKKKDKDHNELDHQEDLDQNGFKDKDFGQQ